MRRLLEVMLLSFFTSSLWFLVAWSGPCRPLPSQARQRLEGAAPLPLGVGAAAAAGLVADVP